MENKLQIRQPTPVPVERLALSPAHGFILSRVDGSTNVPDVLSILPHGEEALACRFLYGLLVMGVMRFDPPVGDGRFHVTAILKDHADQVALESLQEKMVTEWYESLRNKPPHEVLGVSIEATREEIETAYSEAKERVGRDRLVPRLRDRLRSELAVIESRLLDAYLTLIQIPTSVRERPEAPEGEELRGDDLLVRVEMDKTKSKKELEASSNKAEEYYHKARKFAREGDYYNAIQYGKLAISYSAEDARFYFLVGDCQRRNPDARWQRMAEQNYLRAAELDRWNPEYRLILGRFYKSRGMQLRARKQFEEVLELAPSNAEAVAELEAL
jgi:tetratricopeptide (TPR) repeat protein